MEVHTPPAHHLSEQILGIEHLTQDTADRHSDSPLIQEGKKIVDSFLDDLRARNNIVKPAPPRAPSPVRETPPPAPQDPMILIRQHQAIREDDNRPLFMVLEDRSNNNNLPGLQADSAPPSPGTPGSSGSPVVLDIEELLQQGQWNLRQF